jgi:hypothetical protein
VRTGRDFATRQRFLAIRQALNILVDGIAKHVSAQFWFVLQTHRCATRQRYKHFNKIRDDDRIMGLLPVN